MKKLSKKVFLSLFILISLFFVSSIIIYNVQTYRKEYLSIYRTISFIDDFIRPKPNKKSTSNNTIQEKQLDNMLIMDYEVYTIKIKNNSIYRIIGHGESSSDFNVEDIANKIIGTDNKLKIDNLYTSKYAYNYKSNNTIVIINLQSISKRLRLILLESLLLIIILEVLIYLVSLKITKWIIKPAQEAFDKQKDFIADASHELKTPLAVIMASSDELKSDKKNSKYVENIRYESERMNKLIKSLLDLSKLENGINVENYKVENLSKIIEKSVLSFEAVAYENNIMIDSNIQSNIMFKCSKDEIEKLISIITDNAIKHSYKDSTIKINVNKDKNNIIIEIINHGDAIKQGDEDKIFERFYRADKSRKRDTNRYGLGLAIAKNIVNNHNGIIEAFSKEGKTTFKIILKK